MDKETNAFTVSWETDPIHRWFINHLIKITLSLFVFIGIIVLVDNDVNLIHLERAFPFLLFIVIMAIFTERFHRKIAYNITIYPERKEFLFKLYRSNMLVKLKSHEINKIRLNGYLIFYFGDRKILFGGKVDESLIEEVMKIKTIQLGFFSKVFGPRIKVS